MSRRKLEDDKLARDELIRQTVFVRFRLWLEEAIELLGILIGIAVVLVIANWFQIAVIVLAIIAFNRMFP